MSNEKDHSYVSVNVNTKQTIVLFGRKRKKQKRKVKHIGQNKLQDISSRLHDFDFVLCVIDITILLRKKI